MKEKLMKRLIALLTVFLLLLSLLCGCGGQQDDALNQVGGQAGNNVMADHPNNFKDFLEQPEEQPQNQPQQQEPSDEKPEEEPAPEQQNPQEEQPAPEQQQSQNQAPPVANTEPTVDYTAEGWITVYSYNVKLLGYDLNTDADGPGMSKLEAICEELKKIDADIIGLQELERYTSRVGANVDQLEVLARMLGYPYQYYTCTVKRDAGEYGHGILSRYPIKKSEIFRYKDYNIDASEPRALSRCELNVNGKTLVLYNSHLAGHQKEQMRMITKMMKGDKQAGKYAVLTGDMNAYPKMLKPYADKTACVMLNTAENPQNTTTQAMLKIEVNPIDNIVVTNNLEYYWDSYLKSGIKVVETTASDHLPIYTYIKMK
jgi:endonuclease/exonuclease/phosphatase family metal-dependent hydrolase